MKRRTLILPLAAGVLGAAETIRFDSAPPGGLPPRWISAMFDVEDRTFTEAGQVGLWTKADSVTYFDDFQVGGK